MKKYTPILLIAFTVFVAAAAGAVNAAENVSNGTLTCNVTGTSYECDSWSGEQYPVIDLFGEKYVPLFTPDGNFWDSYVNTLASLILDSNETHTLKPGEKVDLSYGYTLEVKQINIDNEEVWLEFTKDGKYVADKNVSIDNDNKTWIVNLNNVQGENNSVIMKVHVKNLFVGTETSVVWIDGIWLIGYANARTLNVGDKFGEFTLAQIVSGIDASNPGSLVFGSASVPDDASVTDNVSVADNAHTSDSPASPSPKKGQIKLTDKNTGSPTSWYWNFWGDIPIKRK